MEKDDLYEEVKAFAMQHEEFSCSMVQQKFKLGYNRGGRIIDQLEFYGVIGPFQVAKKRRVLMRTGYTNITHELKVWKEFFPDIFERKKTFEVRLNDRDFKVGDTLHLKEWDNDKQKFTRNECFRGVNYILHGGQFGIEKGYVVMSIA